ncbi:AMP-binding protein, partial [Arthrobacter sp.]|uniref:AMP-binding protein n=1 Tax=Arthrobacter sp. TaxID=1667 RepID=UPI00258EE861
GHLVQEDRDIATPAFDWLAKNVAASGDRAPGDRAASPASGGPRLRGTRRELASGGSGWGSRSSSDAGFRPMLAELDARRDDHSTAIVDMVRAGGRTASGGRAASGDRAASPAGGWGARSSSRSVTWADLARDVDDLAAGLADLGVRGGDRVSLLVPPGITLTTLIYACLRLGAVIVVADAGLGTKGMSRAIKGAGPAYLIGIERALAGARIYNLPGVKVCSEDFTPATDATKRKLLNVAATVPQLLANGRVMRLAASAPAMGSPGADDDAAVLFTSGSTGPAKGVVYTHRRLAAMRDTLKATYKLEAGTALVAGFAPFALLGPALGATSVTPDMDVTAPRTLTAAALADAAAAINATVVFASPAALVNVVATAAQLTDAHKAALAGVELVLSAGAPLGEPLLARVQDLAPHATLHTPYGMTEALPVTDISLAGIRGAGAGNGVCVGMPVSGATVAVAPLTPEGGVDPGPTTRAHVTGEILVRAPHVKERYDRLWITQEQSASIPGWHRSGDVGHFDDAGRLWVEGRLAHVLTTPAGVRTPVAAELAAEQVPGVARAAVVGVGPAGVQAAVAVVETVPPAKHSGLAGTGLAAQVRSAAAGVGLELSAVLAIDAMPTDIRHNSKIDRTALSAWASRMLAGEKAGRP